jgi:hypothetical protein
MNRSPREQIQSAGVVRDGFLVLHDALTAFELKLHGMDAGDPGVEGGIDFIDAAKDMIKLKLKELLEDETRAYDRLMDSL